MCIGTTVGLPCLYPPPGLLACHLGPGSPRPRTPHGAFVPGIPHPVENNRSISEVPRSTTIQETNQRNLEVLDGQHAVLFLQLLQIIFL